MDKFKEKTMYDYTSWDLNCPYVCKSGKFRSKLIKIFKRKARRKLKNDLRKELDK